MYVKTQKLKFPNDLFQLIDKMTFKRRLYDNILQRDIARAYKKYSNMKNMSYKEIEDYRLKNLKDLIIYAHKYVPFYRNLRDSNWIDINIKSLKDFEKFPIVDKKMLKEAIQNWTLFSTEFDKNPKLVRQHTTWSTWAPFEFPFTILEEADKNWCSRMFEEWYSWRIFDDKMVKVWRWKYKNSILDNIREWLTNTYSICIYDPQNTQDTFLNESRIKYLVKKLLKIKPKYIVAFPSALADLAKFIKKNKLKINFKINWIITSAEQLLDDDKTIIEEVFKTKVFDRYWWTEASLMAFQCPQTIKDWYYHINELRIYLETVDWNNTIYDNPWECVITDFVRYYAPFIRYRLWDNITLSSDRPYKCNHCWNRSRKIVKIWWRFNDTIELSNWNKISPHLRQNILKKYEFIDNYQIIKKKWKDSICIKMVWNKDDSHLLSSLESELKHLFKWVHFDLKFADNIDRNIGWKISQILIEK